MSSHEADRPTVFFLHALGASARSFDAVVSAIGPELEAVALDLPGFGDASPAQGTDVQSMCEAVIAAIRARGPTRWMLVGHSMGGKIATIVAARTLAGEPGLFGLAGVVLLAASPPSPEPMDEARRERMLSWAAAGPLDDAAAREFIDGNTGASLPLAFDEQARFDLERSAPEAWRAWLERGSREDWSAFVGTLALPARVLVGGEDGDLGEAGQRATNLKVYPRARLTALPGAKHLLPYERSRDVADAIVRFWKDEAGTGPVVASAYARLIASARVSRRTRAILSQRAISDVEVGPGS